MLRHRARTMLIVCPAGLTLQWHDEMRDKFGLDFRIVDAALLQELRRSRGLYANPWTHYPAADRQRRLAQAGPPDAAAAGDPPGRAQVSAHVRPARRGRGAHLRAVRPAASTPIDSLRTQAIRTLAPHCEHRLFLSATPHNGYLESFTALLEMLDDHRFVRNVKPNEEQLRRIMVRRMKRELPPRWDGTPGFPVRITDYPRSRPLRRRAAGTRAARPSTRPAGAKARAAAGDAGAAAANFVITLLKKRLFSSPKAFAETIETHLRTMTARSRRLSRRDRATTTPRPGCLACVLRLARIERLDETAEDDAAFAERQEEALTAARRLAPPLTAAREGPAGAPRRVGTPGPGPPGREVRTRSAPGSTRSWRSRRTSGSSSSPSTATPSAGCTSASSAAASRPSGSPSSTAARTRTSGSTIKAVFQEHPALRPGADPARDRRGQRGYQPAEPLPPAAALGDPVEPEPAGAAQRPHRPARPARRPRWTSTTSSRRAGRTSTPARTAARWRTSCTSSPSRRRRPSRSARTSAAQATSSPPRSSRRCSASGPTGRPPTSRSRRRTSSAELKIIRDLARDLQKLTDTLTESRGDLNLTPQAVEHVVRTALRSSITRTSSSAVPRRLPRRVLPHPRPARRLGRRP